MRSTALTFALAMLLASGLALPALAFERPNAVSLAGEWELAPALALPPQTALEGFDLRNERPDFPQLSPEIEELIQQDCMDDPAGYLPDDAEFAAASVPAAWEHSFGTDWNEAGWYRREITVYKDWLQEGSRVWLEFDAVSCAAGVWLNGQWCGGHVGDYTRWRVELTEALRHSSLTGGAGVPARDSEWRSGTTAPQVKDPQAGTQSSPTSITAELLIYVDELPGHITQGFPSMIGPHHGGIWQDLRIYSSPLHGLPPDCIEVRADSASGEIEVRIQTEAGASAATEKPSFWLALSGPDGLIELDMITVGEGGVQIDPATGVVSWKTKLEEYEIWRPEAPYVYEIEVSTGLGCEMEAEGSPPCDTVRVPFAFRDIEMQGYQVRLNGEPIRIRSALNWGYYPGRIAPAPTPEEVREEFAYIKSLGFNAETVCLVVMPDYFYDIADEMGVLIWQEYPTWHNDFDAKHLPTYERELPAWLARDRNHPSIVMRSLSVEAGVADWDVMARLYDTTKRMTDEPVQDNNAWFSHSRPEYTDWYGEDNYFNHNQWARHLLTRLPGQLGELPDKPYIIGESILFNVWPDTAALQSATFDFGGRATLPADSEDKDAGRDARPPVETLPDYLGGASNWPYWFPNCMEACLEVEAKLRESYALRLPAGRDIVRDYLIPQSLAYSADCRRFQIELMHASPRYGGYTVNVVRDMPLLRAGLIDSLGQPRWSAEDWSWHGAETRSPVELDSGGKIVKGSMDDLLKTKYAPAVNNYTSLLVLREGYSDLSQYFSGWPNVRYISNAEVADALGMSGTGEPLVIVSSVLTHELVDYMNEGGAVLLFTSKWPGALGSQPHFYWRDSIFAPPVGPNVASHIITPDWLVAHQPYDLTREVSQVIPVDALEITDKVDPLLRLFDTHDLSTVVTYDQLFATRAGSGMLLATSLDHATPAGQVLLSELLSYADSWLTSHDEMMGMDGWVVSLDGGMTQFFPQTRLTIEELRALAVARPNGIIGLEEGWSFRLDPEERGEAEGWMQTGYNRSEWDRISAGRGWEALGYSYDGMAWYVRQIDVPSDWAGGKIRLVAEGVDDAYTVWINGKAVATHGSFTEHEKTVWLQQTTTELTDFLIPGQQNTLALQVVDITGQGGVWRPVYLAVE